MDEARRVFVENEGAVRKLTPGDLMQPAPVGAAEDPLRVEASIHLPRGGRVAAEPLRPGCFVGLIFAMAALTAGAVAGGKRDRLVVEEERGPAVAAARAHGGGRGIRARR